ncbi:MAG: murein L,D-transpeptidase catalytic domain family protein [Deltaproteobacteria bacterium]|nr:murein L,D-transpeptidase catalytic domain family protein [Deltaproteobacteria bacterium]
MARTNSPIPSTLNGAPTSTPVTAAEPAVEEPAAPPASDRIDGAAAHTDLSNAARRTASLGAEPERRSGVLGAITAHPPPPPLPPGAADIGWEDPEIAPPRGAVTRPRPEVLAAAVKAYHKASEQGLVRNPTLTVIDYSLPSSQPRLWVIDMQRKRLLAQHLVAHGRASSDSRNPAKATSFGNSAGSHKSSLGLLITGATHHGAHGRSLRLHGKEPGFNDLAEARAIVMHGADYATQSFVDQNGHLGRSQGCPALDPDVTQPVIDRIKGGSVVFAYADDRTWLGRSEYVR